MKQLLPLLIVFVGINAKADNWVQKASFPGAGRTYPFCFSIGNKGYMGGGTGMAGTAPNDFWEYDPSINAWTQKAIFPPLVQHAESGFSIGSKGYVYNGYTFQQYDPVTNVWTVKASIPGATLVRTTFGFAVGGKGYLGIGQIGSGLNQNLYQYDTATNAWTQKAIFPGSMRYYSHSFVIGNSGYLIGGWTNTTIYYDLWEYNTLSDSWTQQANFPSSTMPDGAAFSICDKGYYGIGEDSTGGYGADLWQYDPAPNVWNQKTSFPGSGRDECTFFTIGDKAYVGLGGQDGNPLYYDFYEYTPDSPCATGITEIVNTLSNLSISPNPVHEQLTVCGLQLDKNIEIKIYNAEGKIVLSQQYHITANHLTMPVANLPSGIYFVTVGDGENREAKKVVVE